MEEVKTLIERAKNPTQLDFERILACRKPYYNNYYLQNLETGVAGEDKVAEFISRYGNKNWVTLRNVWLYFNGIFECDSLLLANSGLYMFEIKNYNGHFVYENGDCILNDRVLTDNLMTQTKRNFRKLKSIIQQQFPQLNVYGTLVFIGEHNSVDIQSTVTDISITKRDEFKQHILQIAEADKVHQQPLNTEHIITHLRKYETNNPFVPKPLASHEMKKLRKGISCANCHSFDVMISKLYIHCACGYKENREIGILRSICEYLVLTMQKQITQ